MPPTVPGESIHPPGIFPILLPYNLELKWIFGGFVSFDLHNMPTNLKMQKICFIVKQTKKKTQFKKKT